MQRFKSMAHIRYEKEMFGFAEDAFLRERGWKSGTISPGAYCVLTKEVDGKVLTISKSLAMGIEEALEERDLCKCPPEFGECDDDELANARREQEQPDSCPIHDFKD